MKKIILIVFMFLFCIVGINAKTIKNLNLKKIKY